MRNEKKPAGRYDFILGLLAKPRVVAGGVVLLAATVYFMTRGSQFGKNNTAHGSAHAETGGSAEATRQAGIWNTNTNQPIHVQGETIRDCRIGHDYTSRK